MRVLLVEDNTELTALTAAGLNRAGFTLDAFARLDDAREALATVAYDLVVLDLGLPDGDGTRLLREMRSAGNTTPVLIITARGSLNDRVTGLDTGADDYLVKPFAMEELVARCRALLRRPGGCLGTVLQAGNLHLDTVAREVQIGGEVIDMPRREVDLLAALLRRQGHVVPKDRLEEALYAMGEEVASNTIEVHISRLRKTLAGAGARVAVHTVRGIGYMLREAAG